ncbi:hypothetical protein A0H81_13578 [Grifola frondosa]|uniref:Uncharacterized protein n=1 Tax=Grifola frondosa TaxID=5627 RepID=A0A1C7LRF8_GRIFR|nr:hypothetical protein A0H81_13578 [Grifola frondosa]
MRLNEDVLVKETSTDHMISGRNRQCTGSTASGHGPHTGLLPWCGDVPLGQWMAAHETSETSRRSGRLSKSSSSAPEVLQRSPKSSSERVRTVGPHTPARQVPPKTTRTTKSEDGDDELDDESDDEPDGSDNWLFRLEQSAVARTCVVSNGANPFLVEEQDHHLERRDAGARWEDNIDRSVHHQRCRSFRSRPFDVLHPALEQLALRGGQPSFSSTHGLTLVRRERGVGGTHALFLTSLPSSAAADLGPLGRVSTHLGWKWPEEQDHKTASSTSTLLIE